MSDPRQLARDGVEYLRRGDPASARRAFEAIASGGVEDPAVKVALAIACRALGDTTAALAASNQALALAPRDARALLLKADLLADGGDRQGAAAFYLEAVRVAESQPDLAGLPPADVKRAREACEAVGAAIERSVRGVLGSGLTNAGGRFSESLDILFGHRRQYFQQPRYYFFPGLAPIQFFPSDMFPWLEGLEKATEEIQGELQGVLASHAHAFRPYVQSDPSRPQRSQDGLVDNPNWSAFYLWKNGSRVEENIAICPRTAAAVARLPLAELPKRSPSVLFSLLKPGAHIPPHCGLVNTRLIGHLPLIVPPGCSFRVGNETRDWREGKAWVFDDTIEHEAWNRSDRTRVILLFEVWRPELTPAERSAVQSLFSALDATGANSKDWEI